MKKTDKRYIRQKEILLLLPVGRTTFWRWRKTGKFPQPKLVGIRQEVWDFDVFANWIEKNQHWLPNISLKEILTFCVSLTQNTEFKGNRKHQTIGGKRNV